MQITLQIDWNLGGYLMSYIIRFFRVRRCYWNNNVAQRLSYYYYYVNYYGSSMGIRRPSILPFFRYLDYVFCK